MLKVLVASESSVKIAATRTAFYRAFPKHSCEIFGKKSVAKLPNQPIGDMETRKCSFDRIRAIEGSVIDDEYDYIIGIEGGVSKEPLGKMLSFAWVSVMSTHTQVVGQARSGALFLPKPVIELINGGMELGDADDEVFGLSGSKNNEGSVGLMTHRLIKRTQFYSDTIILALIPFLNEELEF